MVLSYKDFLISYSGQNTYKIYFLKTSKIEYLRNVIFMENNKFLKTSFEED